MSARIKAEGDTWRAELADDGDARAGLPADARAQLSHGARRRDDGAGLARLARRAHHAGVDHVQALAEHAAGVRLAERLPDLAYDLVFAQDHRLEAGGDADQVGYGGRVRVGDHRDAVVGEELILDGLRRVVGVDEDLEAVAGREEHRAA